MPDPTPRKPLSDDAEEVVRLLAQHPSATIAPAGVTRLWWMVWDGARSYGAAFNALVAEEIQSANYLTDKRGTLKRWVRDTVRP